jgi:hypothetical protein
MQSPLAVNSKLSACHLSSKNKCSLNAVLCFLMLLSTFFSLTCFILWRNVFKNMHIARTHTHMRHKIFVCFNFYLFQFFLFQFLSLSIFVCFNFCLFQFLSVSIFVCFNFCLFQLTCNLISEQNWCFRRRRELNILIFCDIPSCRPEHKYRYFGGTCISNW